MNPLYQFTVTIGDNKRVLTTEDYNEAYTRWDVLARFGVECYLDHPIDGRIASMEPMANNPQQLVRVECPHGI